MNKLLAGILPGGEIYCNANFFCYANFLLFSDQISGGGQSLLWKKASLCPFADVVPLVSSLGPWNLSVF